MPSTENGSTLADDDSKTEGVTKVRREETLLNSGALQDAIFNSANFSSIATAHQPEIILMDINLPGISGIQALKILREDPVTAHIPVLAISANAMPRDIVKGLEAGFFRYLAKPIKISEFMEALDMALELAEKGLDGALNSESR